MPHNIYDIFECKGYLDSAYPGLIDDVLQNQSLQLGRCGFQSRSASSMQNCCTNVGTQDVDAAKVLIEQHKVGRLLFFQSCNAHLSSRISTSRISSDSLIDSTRLHWQRLFWVCFWHSLRLSLTWIPRLCSFPFRVYFRHSLLSNAIDHSTFRSISNANSSVGKSCLSGERAEHRHIQTHLGCEGYGRAANLHCRVGSFANFGRITCRSFGTIYFLVLLSVVDLTNYFEVFWRTSTVIKAPAVAERVT